MRERFPWTYRRVERRLRRFREGFLLRYSPDASAEDRAYGRAQSLRLAPQVDQDLSRVMPGSGVKMLPPPMIGGPIMHGFANIVISLHADDHPGTVLDLADTTLGHLESAREQARIYWMNPLNWAVELIHALVSLPAYIIAGVFRVPSSKLNRRAIGTLSVSDLIGLAALGVALLGVGRQFKWW